MSELTFAQVGHKQFVERLRYIVAGLESGTIAFVPGATSIEPHLTQTAGPHGARVQNGYFKLNMIYYDSSQDFTSMVKPETPGGVINLQIDDATMGETDSLGKK